MQDIIEQARAAAFDAEVIRLRSAQRERFFLEYMAPVLEAFRSSVIAELNPLKVSAFCFSYRQGHQVSFKVENTHYGEGLPFEFGIHYNPTTGKVSAVHNQHRWNLGQFTSGCAYSFNLNWPDWDEEQFTAFVRHAWEHVKAHLEAPAKDFWISSGFNHPISQRGEPNR